MLRDGATTGAPHSRLGVLFSGSLSYRTVNRQGGSLENISDTSADFVDYLLLHLTDYPNQTLLAA